MIFLIYSVPFGLYSLALYKVLRRSPKKVRYALPLVFTLAFPVLYIPLTDIPDVDIELLPLVGFSIMFIVFLTPAAAAPLIPTPLIDKLEKGETAVFLASTLSFALVAMIGFAEVMGGGGSYEPVTKMTILSKIYANCFKLFAISSIVYFAALTLQKIKI